MEFSSKEFSFKEFNSGYECLDEMKEHYRKGGLGDVKCKKFLISVLESELAPIRAERAKWEKDIPAVYEILKNGSEEAEKVAAETLGDVRRAMKINYFEDQALITEQSKKYNQE